MSRRMILTLWVLLVPCLLAGIATLIFRSDSFSYYPWTTDVVIAALALVALLAPWSTRGISRRL